MLMKNKNFLEGFIVFSVMTGVLLPVRLFFVTHISTDWFGSFGIISAISVLMIILTKKGKLGRFGKMFEHQMNKLQKGKRDKIIYGQSIIFLLILGGTIFAIEQGNSVYVDLKNQLLEEHEEFANPEEILKKKIHYNHQLIKSLRVKFHKILGNNLLPDFKSGNIASQI